MRGLTIAVWVFCINLLFTILASVNPFGLTHNFVLGTEIVDVAYSSQNVTEVSALGVGEIVMGVNLLLSLLLGPLTLVPTLLNLIGIVGIVNWALTACVWVIWSYTLVQIVTGRMLTQVK